MNKLADNKAEIMRHIQEQELQEAKLHGERLCAEYPSDAEAWFLLGAVQGQLGDYPQAEISCRRALDLAPQHPGLHYNMAMVLARQSKLDDALGHLQEVVRLQPDHAEACADIGILLAQREQHPPAIDMLQRALSINPALYRVYAELGRLLMLAYDFDAVIKMTKRALELYPQSAELHYMLGVSFQEQGDVDSAEPPLRRAIEIAPGHARAQAALAAIHGLRGEYDLARELLDALVEANASDPVVTLIYSNFAHRLGREDDAVTLLKKSLDSDSIPKDMRSKLHNSLASIYDRGGRHAEAFEHFRTGNELHGASFNKVGVEQSFAALMKVFPGERLARLPRSSNRSELPIFIVGMPRSGTSLVEQILASHPSVHGAGELGLINRMAMRLPDRMGSDLSYPYCIEQVDAKTLNKMADKYLSVLAKDAAGALRVTDKMPMNFLHLGLIELMLPGARIIHCRRDPRDTCLSCYFTQFGCEHAYAYDLGDLGFYYRQYEMLMAYWKNTLGLSMLEIDYEHLVDDLEGCSRSLIEFCGLSWDKNCLNFHNTSRTVATASHDQVRQPIYRKSVGRWKSYEAYLGPLIEALRLEAERQS